MTTNNHPDIEIYIKGINTAAVVTWLESLWGTLTPIKQAGTVSQFEADYQEHRLPILIIEKANGSYTSLYFESPHTPWTHDADCARQAYTYFSEHGITGKGKTHEVRCMTGSWKEGDTEDDEKWLSISEGGENEILWRSK